MSTHARIAGLPLGPARNIATCWCAALLGCVAQIEGGDNTLAGDVPPPAANEPALGGQGGAAPTPAENGGTGSEEAALSCDAALDARRGLAHDRLRRLSSSELTGTLQALLGTVFDDPLIRDRVAALPVDAMHAAGDFAENTPAGLPLVLAEVAQRAATLGLADPDWRRSLAPCAETVPIGDDCVATLVRDFGGRVWRRELSDDETADYLDFYTEVGGGEHGLELLLKRLLQSPSLVFHLELGTGETSNERLRLSDFEVASRVAYAVTDSMPDESLLDAARNAELGQLGSVTAHTARLLDSPAGRSKLRDFARYYAHLGSRADPPAEVAALGGLEDVSGLGEAMRLEALEFFEFVVFEREGTFRDLMLSTDAFPRAPGLAHIFGTDVSDGGAPLEATAHPGLLHRPALLSSSGKRTNPIVRGAQVRKLFLCGDLALPSDAAAVQAAEQTLLESDQLPNRQAVSEVTSAPACRACHAQINPLGFAFEGYDQLGRPRSEETLLDDQGRILGTFPIDTRVEAPAIEEGGPAVIDDSHELVLAIANSALGRQCFAQRLLEYYRWSPLDEPYDTCLLEETFALGEQATLKEVVTTIIANQDIFWRKAAQ